MLFTKSLLNQTVNVDNPNSIFFMKTGVVVEEDTDSVKLRFESIPGVNTNRPLRFMKRELDV